jgi:class 3 adenylate cyclase
VKIPETSYFQAFSMLVDINGFTQLVSEHDLDVGVGDYVRDVLSGPIVAIENAGGSVIGINGDAIFGILPSADSAAEACQTIAWDLNAVCEYLARTDMVKQLPRPPTLKIGVEFGTLANSTIKTTALGTIPLCLGRATNHCARIIAAGDGNRCHVGPAAYAEGMDKWIGDQPLLEVAGKRGEPIYQYYRYDLGDVWREGFNEDGEFYW